jgi:dUTPase
MLTAGAVFEPGTGNQLVLKKDKAGTPLFWELGPNETLVVMTTETVKIPGDLCASYSPLHRLATAGVMLLNPAIVEPLYDGPLSCFLVNFSSQKVQIVPGAPISKIIFHKVSNAPGKPRPQKLDADEYKTQLSKNATLFHRSFLNVSGIEERAAAKAQGALKSVVFSGGLVVGLLVLFATVEPLLSTWLYERTGVRTATQRTQDAELLKDIESARAMLMSATERKVLESSVMELKDELAKVATQLEEMRKTRK